MADSCSGFTGSGRRAGAFWRCISRMGGRYRHRLRRRARARGSSGDGHSRGISGRVPCLCGWGPLFAGWVVVGRAAPFVPGGLGSATCSVPGPVSAGGGRAGCGDSESAFPPGLAGGRVDYSPGPSPSSVRRESSLSWGSGIVHSRLPLRRLRAASCGVPHGHRRRL